MVTYYLRAGPSTPGSHRTGFGISSTPPSRQFGVNGDRDIYIPAGDVGFYSENGTARPLVPGMVLTIEPGLYVAEDAAAPAEFRGLGVRIEDDILVTAGGNDNLTIATPKTVADLEALSAG